MGLIEWVAVGFGLGCVLLTIRQSVWCWPMGLVQVVLYVHVFYQARLYSDVILHVIYVVLQIYGWYAWLHGGADRGKLTVSRLSRRHLLLWAAAGVAATLAVGGLMSRFTGADRPYWDASILAFSLVAQWLMARKVVESWVFWIAVDVLAVGLYAVKRLYPTTALYSVFLVLAIIGLLEWRRATSRTREAPPA